MRPALALLVSALLLAGCGGSGKKASSNGVAAKSATDIVAAALSTANAASSVHVSGTGTENGEAVVLDVHLVAGKGATGTISERGLSFDLVRIGPTVYIKGSKAFYTKFVGASAAQLLAGKWLKGSVLKGELAALAPLTDLRKFFTGTLSAHGTLTKAGVTTMRGAQVVGVTSSKGGTLYVAAVGPAYPVEITKSGPSGGTLVFDLWNQPVTLTAPANAVDLSKLP